MGWKNSGEDLFNFTEVGSTMKITAIISCKNRQENLDYCLASIAANSYVPWVIVVDFGSTIPIVSKYPWQKVIRVNRHTKVFHKARAVNIGLKAAITRYICMTDADQIFDKNFFSTICDILTHNNVFVCCRTYKLHNNPSFYGVTPETVGEKYNDLLTAAKEVREPYGDGCCHATKKKWLCTVGGLEEQFIGWGAQDSDLRRRAARHKNRIVEISDRTTMIHLQHPKEVEPGQYHSAEVCAKNIALYKHRRLINALYANTGKKWGRM